MKQEIHTYLMTCDWCQKTLLTSTAPGQLQPDQLGWGVLTYYDDNTPIMKRKDLCPSCAQKALRTLDYGILYFGNRQGISLYERNYLKERK